MYAKCALLIYSLFLSVTEEGPSFDYTVIAISPLRISNASRTAQIALFIWIDDVALEDFEYFNVTLAVTGRVGTNIPQFDGTARNEFLGSLQVLIEDGTGE